MSNTVITFGVFILQRKHIQFGLYTRGIYGFTYLFSMIGKKNSHTKYVYIFMNQIFKYSQFLIEVTGHFQLIF